MPVLSLKHLTATERRAYVLADNKLALNAGWDRDVLAIELQGLTDLDFDMDRHLLQILYFRQVANMRE